MKRTRIKQKDLANRLYEIAGRMFAKWGPDVVNYTNFDSLAKMTNQKLNHPVSLGTFCSKYEKLRHLITEMAKMKTDMLEVKVEEPQSTNVTPVETRTIISVETIITFSDGEEVRYSGTLPKVELEETTFFNHGLFHYTSEKEIVIKRGRYAGCNIKNPKMVEDKFRTLEFFVKWCQDRILDMQSGRVPPNASKTIDNETLLRAIKGAEKLILSQKEF